MGRKWVKIGAIGGSVTYGQGTSNTSLYAWFNVVTDWLAAGFPDVRVVGRNGAVSATPSDYMVMCLDRSVDPDVDLVFVEYQLNDGFEDRLLNNAIVTNMERLLRRLLDLPGKPAVVLMQVPQHGMAADAPDKTPFHLTSEDLEGALAQYYDVQYLSLRTALYRLAAIEQREGFRWRQLFIDHHPGDAGNRAMADLAAFLIQQTAIELLMDPFGAEDEQLLARPLPPPMYKGNAPPASAMCLRGDVFTSLVTVNDGWTWVNEGSVWKPKWGFVATAPGAKLTVRVDTRRPGSPPEELVGVFVQHLRSYERMGVATVSCMGSCTCSSTRIDAHTALRESQIFQAQVNATQAEACDITITVLEETKSGEHKFKVTGLVIADSPRSASVLSQMVDSATGVLPAFADVRDEAVVW